MKLSDDTGKVSVDHVEIPKFARTSMSYIKALRSNKARTQII